MTAGGRDRAVVLWDVATGRATRTLLPPEEQFDFNMSPIDGRMAAFGPDGKTVAVGRPDGWVRFFEVNSGKQTASWKAQAKAVQAVAFTPDGKMLLAGGPAPEIKVWDIKEGRESASLTGLRASMATPGPFHPTGSSTNWRGRRVGGHWPPTPRSIKIWSAEGWKDVGEMRIIHGRCRGRGLRPDGKDPQHLVGD